MARSYAPQMYVPNSYIASGFFLFLAMVLITIGFIMFVNMPPSHSSAVRDMTDDDYIPAADLPPIVDAKPEAA